MLSLVEETAGSFGETYASKLKNFVPKSAHSALMKRGSDNGTRIVKGNIMSSLIFHSDNEIVGLA